jgi:hypothetical protein
LKSSCEPRYRSAPIVIRIETSSALITTPSVTAPISSAGLPPASISLAIARQIDPETAFVPG